MLFVEPFSYALVSQLVFQQRICGRTFTIDHEAGL